MHEQTRRPWPASLLACVLSSPLLLIASPARAVEPFFPPPQPSGSLAVKLYPMENVTPGNVTLVTFGIPFTRGSLPPSALGTVRVLRNGSEVPAFVQALTPWRHVSNAAIDGQSVRVVRIQIRHTFAVGHPNSETITVEWGQTPRTQNVTTFTNPRTAWHQVTSGSFVAADNVSEPDVYAVLPKQHLAQGPLKLTRMLPFGDSVTPTRSDPAVMDATEHWPGFVEQEHAHKNNFFTVINEDDPRVTPANRCPYKTDSEPWLYDRPSTMFVLYMRSGALKPLREAVRNAQFYKDRLWPDTTTPPRAIGLFKLKTPDPNTFAGGNGAMYSFNESLAYTHWLTGDDAVLPHIRWVVTAHETNDEPTRWSPSLGTWTERHTAFRLLANIVGYEVFGDTAYRNRIVSQSGDFIWHQNGAGGQLPGNRVDGGLYHQGSQHGDGDGLVASSWMTVLMVDAMIRAYAFTENPEIGHFVRRVGNFLETANKVDGDHLYDFGPLAYPDYMMAIDGSSNERDGSMVEHALEVAGAVAWAAYFGELLGSPDDSLAGLLEDLYFTYDIGVNHWIRPTGPPAGNTAFRVSPWRKWGWEHRPSGSLSSLAAQLGEGGTPPTVTLTSPANGATFAAPATIILNAAASATNATIVRVEFFQGATKLGEDATAPYSFTWSGVPAGSYVLTAKATDSLGASAISAAVAVSVTNAGCALSTPSSIYNQSFPAQAGTFTLVVDATPQPVGGLLQDTGIGLNTAPPVGETNSFQTAATVRFNTANSRIEARSGSGYPATTLPWAANQTYRLRFVVSVPAHTYSAFVTPPGGSEQLIGTGLAFRSNYTAAASLNNLRGAVDGGSILVCPVSLPAPGDTTPPAVSITAPAAGSTVSGTITISANASDNVGVTGVQFLVDGAPAGPEDAASPYSLSFNTVPLANGSHTVSARARDAAGNTATSSPVSVVVRNCGTSTPASVYNRSFPAQAGTFTAVVDATPRAVGGSLLDTGIGINTAPPVGESNSFQTAVTVRFNSANSRIEARNGFAYPPTTIAWAAGQTYRLRLVVNVPAHTYSAYVTPPGGSEQLIGTNLAFRSNYAAAASLNNVRGAVDGGSIEVCPIMLP